MNKGLLDILKTRLWMISPDFAHNVRPVLQANLQTHAAFETEEDRTPGYIVGKDAQPIIKEYQVTERGKKCSRWSMEDMDEPFVNVLNVDGPITRYGGGCSYGSAEHRDWMIQAASNEFCVGHVFYIDTPGGSAWTKNDYQQAIDYAHSKGQKVLAFIDGTCASAGMYLASLCDEVYYMHPKDQIGCIGVMAAFYTEKNGTTNQYTNETYHELYDPESFDKNKWARDIANDDNDELLIEELTELGKEFRSDVKKAFPGATDEHLHGKVFDCDEVKGILCDGQMSFAEAIMRVFALSDGSAQPLQRVPVNSDEDNNSHSKTNKNMKKYETLAAACGCEDIVVTEEGTHLDQSLCDALEQKLTADKEALDKANEQVQNLQAEVDEQKKTAENAAATAKAESDKAIETLKAEHAKAIEDMKAEHEKALADAKAESDKALAEAKETADAALADKQKALDGANEALKTAEQQMADKDAQIKALTEAPAQQEEGSAQSNGTGAPAAGTFPTCMPAYDSTKSPLENKRIRQEYMKAHQA